MSSFRRLANKTFHFHVRNKPDCVRIVNSLVTSKNDSIICPFIDENFSHEMLTRDFRSVTFCEPREALREPLKSHIKSNYKHKHKQIKIHEDNLFKLAFRHHFTEEEQERCDSILDLSLKQADKRSDSSIKPKLKLMLPLIEVAYSTTFLKILYTQMSLRSGLNSREYLNTYMLISDRVYSCLSSKPSVNLQLYRQPTVLCNAIFNITKLETFDLNTTFKIKPKALQGSQRSHNVHYKDVHFILLEPKIDLLLQTSPRALLEFRFFINQIMARRVEKVIDFLRQWFLYDGEMEQLGISLKCRAGDLDPTTYFALFSLLRSKPTYGNSSFTYAAIHYDKLVAEQCDIDDEKIRM